MLAAALVLAAGLIAIAPQDPVVGDPVLVVVRDLPIGTSLQAGDVESARVPDPPDGAARDPTGLIGRVLAGPVRRGEVVTDVRLVAPAGPDPGPGRVAVPVQPADPAIVDLLAVGMRVAVVLVGEDGSPTLLAADAVVLVVADRGDRGSTGRPVVLAVPLETADRIVASALSGAIALRFA